MRVFQIGAAGGIGSRLATLLTDRGDAVTGLHRAPEQADPVRATGASPLVGDLITDSVDDLAGKMRGHDAVVFSAGAHGTGTEQTTLIDGRGLEKAADAAVRAGVPRFVLVSVIPDAGRSGERNDAFEHYMQVKKRADVYLAGTDLQWLIVRPGTLVDSPGTGQVTARAAVEYGAVPRDDVAAFIDAALHQPDLHHEVIELVAGTTPVVDAVAALVRRR